tara:strand:+ start:186 stop:434 length:249 start_codon:yes stop_codon:yes gene_type:complete
MSNRKEQKDFYASDKGNAHRKRLHERYGDDPLFCSHENFVNGIKYIEMISQGIKPLSNFDDMVLVYSGTDYEITRKDYQKIK